MHELLEKIKKIEALIAGAQTEGEKNAAISAKERIMAKFPALDPKLNLVEYSLKVNNNWHKKLLLAICRKYEVRPYRYPRQKHTTVMVRVNPEFLNQVLWKEFLEYAHLLEGLVNDITDEMIGRIHQHEEEDVVQGNLE